MATGLQVCKATGLNYYRARELKGYRASGLKGYRVGLLLALKITSLQGYRVPRDSTDSNRTSAAGPVETKPGLSPPDAE